MTHGVGATSPSKGHQQDDRMSVITGYSMKGLNTKHLQDLTTMESSNRSTINDTYQLIKEREDCRDIDKMMLQMGDINSGMVAQEYVRGDLREN